MTVSDKLREVLANPDSDDQAVFSAEQRQELLFQVFSAVVLGGAMCQADEALEPYLTVTKALYKDLVSVYKHADTQEILIGSQAFMILSFDQDANGGGLFTSAENRYNVCLVTISASKQQIAVIKKTFKPFW